MGSGAVIISFYVLYAVEQNLCLVTSVNLQFECGVSNCSVAQVRYTGKAKILIVLYKKRWVFSPSKFSGWLSSG